MNYLKLSSTFLIIILCTIFSSFQNVLGQEAENNVAAYNENDFGTLDTPRNYPLPLNKNDSLLVPCRKLNSKIEIFSDFGEISDITKILKKRYKDLTDSEKSQIIINASHYKTNKLRDILITIALTDRNNLPNRQNCIKCLSLINSDSTHKVLLLLLNDKDKEIAMLSALSLAQLGDKENSFKYIQKHQNEFIDKVDIHTALMVINTAQSVKLLMKLSENKDPSFALDALAALSLIGYCDFAYSGFCKYINSKIWQVRQKTAWCLVYYIGKQEVFRLIDKIPLDNNGFIKEDITLINSIYRF